MGFVVCWPLVGVCCGGGLVLVLVGNIGARGRFRGVVVLSCATRLLCPLGLLGRACVLRAAVLLRAPSVSRCPGCCCAVCVVGGGSERGRGGGAGGGVPAGAAAIGNSMHARALSVTLCTRKHLHTQRTLHSVGQRGGCFDVGRCTTQTQPVSGAD